MKTFEWNALDEHGRRSALARPAQRSDAQLQARVAEIVGEVRTRGWSGLCELAWSIDGAEPRLIEVGPGAAEARRILSQPQLDALELAVSNIRTFHEACRPDELAVETAPGLVVRKVWRPIDRIGIYIPGGATPLFSTLMMLAIPARVAGVRDIIAVTPPRPDGSLDPVMALAAQLCDIAAMWIVGGAQAVAALAFGAGAIPKVHKVCGPGNAWVAEAKKLVASTPGGPAIDMPAGPSELMVIADGYADPALVAADLLSQCEHDPAAQVMLVSPSRELAISTTSEMEHRTSALPRAAIVRASLSQARFILTDDLAEAVDVANAYAPEHLSLAVAEPEALVPLVRNAGAVFAGGSAAETFSDYIAGSSHVLPTDGAARAWSGVGVHTFLREMTVQSISLDAAARIAAPASLLARMEGLEAHAQAADVRLERAR